MVETSNVAQGAGAFWPGANIAREATSLYAPGIVGRLATNNFQKSISDYQGTGKFKFDVRPSTLTSNMFAKSVQTSIMYGMRDAMVKQDDGVAQKGWKGFVIGGTYGLANHLPSIRYFLKDKLGTESTLQQYKNLLAKHRPIIYSTAHIRGLSSAFTQSTFWMSETLAKQQGCSDGQARTVASLASNVPATLMLTQYTKAINPNYVKPSLAIDLKSKFLMFLCLSVERFAQESSNEFINGSKRGESAADESSAVV